MEKSDKIIWLMLVIAGAYLAITTARAAVTDHGLWAIVILFAVFTVDGVIELVKTLKK